MTSPSAAALAGPHNNELSLLLTLLQLTVIVLAGRVGGAIAQRYGQSAAVGEMVIGILLGPSLMAIAGTLITTPALRRYKSRADELPLAAGSPHTIR